MRGLRSFVVSALLCGAEASLCLEQGIDTCSLGSRGSSLLQISQETSSAKASSKNLARRLAKVARANTTQSSTRELLESFRICGECKHFQRFGEPHDGGYLTCLDGLQSGTLKAAYSLGVEHHDKWSDDVVRQLGVGVNQFDCTVAQGPPCKDCHFFQKCIRSRSGAEDAFVGQSVTLSEALQQSGQGDAAPHSLLLKIDIEGSEWPIFAEESEALLQKFQQIIVEFHWLDKVEKHDQYLKAVKNLLNAGFQVAHLHGNNYGGMYSDGEDRIPQVLEVTYISTGASDAPCSDEQILLADDAPNLPEAAELPLAEMGGV